MKPECQHPYVARYCVDCGLRAKGAAAEAETRVTDGLMGDVEYAFDGYDEGKINRVQLAEAISRALAVRAIPIPLSEAERAVVEAAKILSKWAVWYKGSSLTLAHAIDGDSPTHTEWLEIGDALIALRAAAPDPREEPR